MRNQNANVSDRSNARFAVVDAMVRRRRRAADLSGGKHDDFAAGSSKVSVCAERAKPALTIFDGTFAGSDELTDAPCAPAQRAPAELDPTSLWEIPGLP
jgi:hypothetical protein